MLNERSTPFPGRTPGRIQYTYTTTFIKSPLVQGPSYSQTHIYSAKSPSLSVDCEVIAVSIEEKACGACGGGEGGERTEENLFPNTI